eukprot:TRINITY_DN676_c0_g1_i1.p1 TRINITY_DN676_c0_g1~~TRINITY_DN676_c0_g1_i1.p1  ORF type:complete len:230 (+),score=48.49 TRINITY_DN676_c0_g1_i1:109-798(+)
MLSSVRALLPAVLPSFAKPFAVQAAFIHHAPHMKKFDIPEIKCSSEWTPQVHGIGIPEVDEQHKNLFKLMNNLDEEVHHKEVSQKAVEDILDEMIDDTKYHFRREEDIMRMHGSPNPEIEQHALLHNDFVKFLKTAAHDLKNGDHITEVQVEDWRRWWSDHIAGPDKHMLKQMKPIPWNCLNAQVNQPPLDAMERDTSQDEDSYTRNRNLQPNVHVVRSPDGQGWWQKS